MYVWFSIMALCTPPLTSIYVEGDLLLRNTVNGQLSMTYGTWKESNRFDKNEPESAFYGITTP